MIYVTVSAWAYTSSIGTTVYAVPSDGIYVFSINLLAFKDEMFGRVRLQLTTSSVGSITVSDVMSQNSWDSFGGLTVQSMIKGDVIRIDIQRKLNMLKPISQSKITFNGFFYRPPSLSAAWNLAIVSGFPLFTIGPKFILSKSIVNKTLIFINIVTKCNIVL